MNIAKKSTTKNGKIVNGTAETKVPNAIYIAEDDVQPMGPVAGNELPILGEATATTSTENLEDVIICNVELPKESCKNVGDASSCATNASTPTNGGLKRVSDSIVQTISKKFKSTPPPASAAAPVTPVHVVPKMVLLTSEKLNLLIKEALKDELKAYHKEMTEQFVKELDGMKIMMDYWHKTTQKLYFELAQLKAKSKAEVTGSSSTVKDSPCNLPPASANPVTSQHLKILHSSSSGGHAFPLNANQPQPAQLLAISRGAHLPLLPAPVVIQPKKSAQAAARESSFIDLTTEEDACKAKDSSNLEQRQDAPPTPQTTHASTSDATIKKGTNAVEKIPCPPLPPPSQQAPPTARDLPPKPLVNLTINEDGVHLTWDCSVSQCHEEAASYHLFSYQSLKDAPDKFMWKRVGNMDAMPLPMVCTLEKSKLDRQAAFAIRGVDQHSRLGPFSDIVVLNKESIT